MNARLAYRVKARCACTGFCAAALALSIGGIGHAQSPGFVRFVESMDPNDRWRETKAKLGHETRNVFSSYYRTRRLEVAVAHDGTFRLGDLMQAERLHPQAVGVLAGHTGEAPETKPGEPTAGEDFAFARLPSDPSASAIENLRVALDPAYAQSGRAYVWAREVLPPSWSFTQAPMKIHAGDWIEFGIGLEAAVLLGEATQARFMLTAHFDGREVTVFEATLDPTNPEHTDRWFDHRIALDELAGSTCEFQFTIDNVRDGEIVRDALSLAAPLISSPTVYTAVAANDPGAPNVILISIDTLRADHLGAYGYARDTSPNIDALAAESVLFEQAIAPSSWTTPSHASIFTGLHPGVHGAGVQSKGYRLRDEMLTLAEYARAAGYQTVAFTEGAAVGASFGFAQGFDRYSDGESKHYRYVEKTFGAAGDWLGAHHAHPFFMFVHTYETHVHYIAPERFWRKYSTVEPTTEMTRDPERFKDHMVDWYDAEIAYTDYALGRFIEKLRALGLLENTLLILLSDHGEQFWEHGAIGHIEHMYDEILHVPLIIRLPGGPRLGRRVSDLVTTTDVFATITESLGLPAAVPRDSQSLVSLLGAHAATSYSRTVVHSQLHLFDRLYHRETGGRVEWTTDTLRSATEKYHRSDKTWIRKMLIGGMVPSADDARKYVEELYELETDSGERKNVAREHAQRVTELREMLEEKLSDIDARYREMRKGAPAPAQLTESELDELKALGYL